MIEPSIPAPTRQAASSPQSTIHVPVMRRIMAVFPSCITLADCFRPIAAADSESRALVERDRHYQKSTAPSQTDGCQRIVGDLRRACHGLWAQLVVRTGTTRTMREAGRCGVPSAGPCATRSSWCEICIVRVRLCAQAQNAFRGPTHPGRFAFRATALDFAPQRCGQRTLPGCPRARVGGLWTRCFDFQSRFFRLLFDLRC